MEINFTYVGIFAVGMFFQAFSMLGGIWGKGDLKKLLIAFAFGLIGLMPGKNESNYDLKFHLFFSCLLAAFYFTGEFSKRLISRISARSLIVFNIIMLYVVYQAHFEYHKVIFLILLIPSILTLINGFTNMDKYFGWQVFFYVWFSVMVIVIALVYFAFGNFLKVFGWSEQGEAISYVDLFFIGAAFLYIIANFWYVVQLIPFTKKHQKYTERLKEIRTHMQLLAYGYIWQKDDSVGNFLTLIVLPVFLLINYQFGFISETILVSLVLSLMPLVNRFDSSVAAEGDGIGIIINNLKK